MARQRPSKSRPPEVCPVCGADVHPNALACRECGADHLSGWQKDAGDYDGVDLPDEDFDYDEFVRREFGKSPKPSGMHAGWWLVALVLLVITILALLFGPGR